MITKTEHCVSAVSVPHPWPSIQWPRVAQNILPTFPPFSVRLWHHQDQIQGHLQAATQLGHLSDLTLLKNIELARSISVIHLCLGNTKKIRLTSNTDMTSMYICVYNIFRSFVYLIVFRSQITIWAINTTFCRHKLWILILIWAQTQKQNKFNVKSLSQPQNLLLKQHVF